MGKLVFKLMAGTDINTFNDLVNKHLDAGWRFVATSTVMINELQSLDGKYLQYTVAMLYEESEPKPQEEAK